MRRDDPPPRRVGPAVAPRLGRAQRRVARVRTRRAGSAACVSRRGRVASSGSPTFRDAFFPHDEGVKEFFEELKRDVEPDLVLTHARHDLHQDHRIVCELDVEHVPRPPDPRVRDPQVRRRPRLAERLRARRGAARAAKGELLDRAFRDAARQALVHRGRLPRPDAAAGRRVELADRVCRGVLRPQGARWDRGGVACRPAPRRRLQHA